MGIFKLPKNKKFGYIPRYYKNDSEGSPFEIKGKFDDYRKTADNPGGIKNRFNNAMDDLKVGSSGQVNKRIFIIVAVLLLIFLFIIDFDLSIFFG